MRSQQERSRWHKEFKDEPWYVAATIVKFSSCLLILGALLIVGAGMNGSGSELEVQAERPLVADSFDARAPDRAGAIDRARREESYGGVLPVSARRSEAPK